MALDPDPGWRFDFELITGGAVRRFVVLAASYDWRAVITRAHRMGMLERNLALFPGWQLGRQVQHERIERRDFLGAIASVKRATLGELELDVLSWLSAQWWAQGAPRDGITRFTWYGLGRDLWATGRRWEAGGRDNRMLQEAVDNLVGAVVTLSGYNVHTGEATPALFSDVHILRSVVGKHRRSAASDSARDGALREDTVEVRLEDWLVAQLLGDCVALLDWQIQRELDGLSKRLWCYLAGRGPDFAPAAWPGEELLIVPLNADVYEGWSLHSARERNNRARVATATERIVRTDPRYVTIVVEPDADDRRRYQLRALRRVVTAPVTPAADEQAPAAAHRRSILESGRQKPTTF